MAPSTRSSPLCQRPTDGSLQGDPISACQLQDPKANLVSMDELPSVLGALMVKLVPFNQSRLQDSVSQWTNLSLQ
jgi:hypothetical protein